MAEGFFGGKGKFYVPSKEPDSGKKHHIGGERKVGNLR